MRILLLEDEAMLRSSIKEFLEELGNDVIDCFDGDTALDILKAESFDALVLDICVPGCDGYGVLEYVRQKEPFLPVVFITAMTDIDDISKAYALGCSDYLKKPFRLQELWLRLVSITKLISAKEPVNTLKLGEKYGWDKKQKALMQNGSVMSLTKKHTDILELLIQNIGFCVPLERFRSSVWGREDIDDATIRAEISRLKKILGEEFVANVKGVGYKIDKV
jgi:two-component system, OmpR family, response regulator